MTMIRTHFMHNTALPRRRTDRARAVLKALAGAGTVFLRIDYGPVEPEPEKRIDKENSIGGLGLMHPLLAKGAFHFTMPRVPPRSKRHEHGTASMSYLESVPELTICQSTFYQRPEHWDEIAAGQLAFAKLLYPLLRPRYGWIDEFGDIVRSRVLEDGWPTRLFWANFFGPEMVETIGKRTLVRAAGRVDGGSVEKLDDGGVLFVVTPRFQDWQYSKAEEPLEALRSAIPEIKRYRARDVWSKGGRFTGSMDEQPGDDEIVLPRQRKPKSPARRKKG